MFTTLRNAKQYTYCIWCGNEFEITSHDDTIKPLCSTCKRKQYKRIGVDKHGIPIEVLR